MASRPAMLRAIIMLEVASFISSFRNRPLAWHGRNSPSMACVILSEKECWLIEAGAGDIGE